MKKLRSTKFAIALAASAALMGGTAATAGHHKEKAATQNIVEKAAATDDFSTLVAAVTAADLAGTLSGDGPFTVFAPTNDAFAALPDGTVETLLKPENKGQLQSVLTYHVVAGRLKAKYLIGLVKKSKSGVARIGTVQGGILKATVDSHGALILTDEQGRSSKVVMADVNQSNGVIHAIDAVVLPG